MGDEMIRVALTHPSKLSGAFLLSLVISIWSANAGVSSLISGLNVAYEQKETRSLVHIHLRSLAITVGALVAGIAALIIVVAVPVVQSFIRAGGPDVLELLRWPVLFASSTGFVAVLYRYGPNCKRGGRRRVLFGAMFASAVWVAVSLGFSWYLSDVANYDRTYGSLGSLMGFMMWVWLGLMVILFGAEMNSELERISGR
jgi:membrane protein